MREATRTVPALSFALAVLLSTGCGKAGTQPEGRGDAHAAARDVHAGGDEHGTGGAHAEEGAGVPLESFRGLTLMQVPPPRPEGAWYPGEAIGDEGAEAVLTAPVAGIVSGPPFPPGRAVGAGTALLTLSSPELADVKARWLSARARRERAERERAREERLAEAGATAAQEVEAARAEASSAAAEEEAARLGLEARGLSPSEAGATFVVRAPAAGSVVAWRVRRGQGVVAGEELGRLQAAAASLAKLELPLPGPDWKLGDTTDVRASDGRAWTGRVEGLPARLTDDTRRLAYRLRLSGGPFPVPGKPVEVRVPFAAAVILPQSALQQVEGAWGVFVKEGGVAVFRKVRRGTELGGDVTVLDGVTPGETVVSGGSYLLKAALLKRLGGGDEHAH